MIDSGNFNFSFSGLKTAVLYAVKKNPKIMRQQQLKAAFCAEFQQAVIDVLISKTLQAAEKYRPRTVMLAGGVSANRELRAQMKNAIAIKLPKTAYQIPSNEYSLDNAAMIAIAAYYRWKRTAKRNKSLGWRKLNPDANLKIN